MADNEPQEQVVVVQGAPQPQGEGGEAQEPASEAVQHPAKVMRIGSMVRQLLDEVRQAPLDEASRSRLRAVYETSVKELGEVLSPDLQEELNSLSVPFSDATPPSEAELRVAHAQLVGWLEGLFHGIQAMLFAQQMQSRAQLEEIRRRGLPSVAGGPEPPSPGGTYL
ncbi:MAG TPA: proteasome activator [Actinomycetota bacterium]|nr:proteasome activator [Actinomycetota bacterium]